MLEPLLFERIYPNDEWFISADGTRQQAAAAIEKSKNKVFQDNPAAMYRLFEHSGFQNTNMSVLMFNDTFESPQMSSLYYTKSVVDFLNKNGLHIILAENVVKYSGTRINLNRSNFLKNLKLLEGNGGLDGNFDSPPRAFQLDSVQDLIDNNKLTNVTVYTPEFGIENCTNRYTFNFVYRDVYINSFIDSIINTESSSKKKIKTRFLNYNWRYEPYRHLVAAFLSNYDTKMSWYYSASKNIFNNSSWFNITDPRLINGLKILNASLPLNLDTDVKRVVKLKGTIEDRATPPTTKFYPKLVSPKVFDSTFCTVVNESGFLDTTSYISDKTLTAIWNMSPFVLVAPPNTLALMKRMGFKTFSKYWDESYDTKLDHKKRLFKVFDTIDTISKLSDSEVASMYQDMQNILIYNKKILENWNEEHRL